MWHSLKEANAVKTIASEMQAFIHACTFVTSPIKIEGKIR